MSYTIDYKLKKTCFGENCLRVLRFLSPILLILASSSSIYAQAPAGDSKRILFLGDSLTDGYGVERENSYPGLIEKMILAQDLDYSVHNAGVSGDTSAGGLRRIDWLLRNKVDLLVLALGANDGLRGFDPQTTKKNLLAIIAKAKKANPQVKILLAGMMVPPNMGKAYAKRFAAVYPEIAQLTKATLYPFLLEGVAADPKLNLRDGIHPNEQGYIIIANSLWKKLRPMLD